MNDKTLEDILNIDGIPENDRKFIIEIDLPADADLDDITKLALESYKEQMENIQHIEQKYRSRALEVAKDFLTLAKDSIAKKHDVSQKDEKLEIDRGKVNPKEGGVAPNGKKTRADVLSIAK